MAFLTDYMMQHKSMVSNLIEDDLNESIESTSEESEIPNTVEEHYASSELTPNSIMCEEKIQSSNSSQVFKKPKKIKKVLASEMVAEPMINYLKAKTIQKVEDSPEHLFLKSIIPDFKNLNDKNQRRFKNTIFSSLDKLLDEQDTLSASTFIYSNNFRPSYSHQVPIQQHTLNQSQPSLNNETETVHHTTHLHYSESPEFSSSESSSSYQ